MGPGAGTKAGHLTFVLPHQIQSVEPRLWKREQRNSEATHPEKQRHLARGEEDMFVLRVDCCQDHGSGEWALAAGLVANTKRMLAEEL